MRKLSPAIILAILVFSASAATVYVDANGTGDYPTIQAAIDAANKGDEVIAADGTYTGPGNSSISLSKSITVSSENGPEYSIIDCNYAQRGILFERDYDDPNYSIPHAKVQGFTIRNARVGVNFHDSNSVLDKCWIYHNKTGVYCDNRSDGSMATITNCKIFDNATYGIRGVKADARVRNSIIIRNINGIYFYGRFYITNSIISENKGYGIESSEWDEITNCIIRDNYFGQISKPYSRVTYSNIQGGYAGQGNIDEDPLFITNYHLMPNSPCINAGDPNFIPGPNETDFDGEPRVVGGRVDIGPYEAPSDFNHPILAVSPERLSFNAAVGRPNPEPQIIRINNIGIKRLNWNLIENCDWLSAAPRKGTTASNSTNEVKIAVDANTLEPGDYLCILKIIARNAVYSPAEIRVTLRVSNVLYVPEDYETIQQAIDAANNYDLVLVDDATYTGEGNRKITFRGKPVTVKSLNGPENCIIDCQGQTRAFEFTNGEKSDSILDGFTVKNGYSENNGGAIFCEESGPTIKNCVITENHANRGAGIYCNDLCSSSSYCRVLTLINCSIKNNASKYGAGISSDDSDLVIKSCSIEDNNAATGHGAGIVFHGSDNRLNISESIIIRNKAQSSAGIEASGDSLIKIDKCIISENEVSTGIGGGMIFHNRCNVEIKDSIIIGNKSYAGGAISCGDDSVVAVRNSLIAGNRAERWDGGGILLGRNTYCSIINSSIVDNFAFGRGGGILCIDAELNITNSIIQNNIADDCSNICVDDRSNAYLSYANVDSSENSICVGYKSQLNWGPGNIDVDPCFVTPGYWDPNGTPTDANDDFWVNGDYHLLLESLCINAGDPNYIAELDETDLDGNPRVVDGRIDIGCYESNPVLVNLRICPSVINAKGHGRYITAFITMPEGITPDDINDAEPLLFMPGRIEATQQFVWQSRSWRHRRTYIMAVFDKSDCMENLSPGMNEINIIGQLNTGRFFYGTDNLRVIQWRPWPWRYRNRLK